MSSSDNPAEKAADGSFLSRWSRRKVEAKNEPAPDIALAKSSIGAPPGTKMPETPLPERTSSSDERATEELPAIDSMTHQDDFSPFMAKDVEPGLRNQAMKKLFTDPHYQFAQMDKLDTYIDDYSQPDPLPAGMLRKMNQAWSLGLFDDEEKDAVSQAVVPAADAENAVPADAEAATAEDVVPPAAGELPATDDGVAADENTGDCVAVPAKASPKNAR